MNIKQYFFEYESSYIPAEEVMQITETMLDDFYLKANDTEQFNVFFHLQNELFYLLNKGLNKEAAHISYLISYYLFVVLTPPHSEILAQEFAKEAIKMDNCPKYLEWLDEVKAGN